ncbi:MAG: imidazole glycerol phosphate synthase subunit HisH [Bacteroidetes bacterium]|nr:imidazole glycerol phosphate synthase subunit HisH [Bacteroidota bacterium]
MISVVDYGMGNIGSIKNMLKKIGEDSQLIDKPDNLNPSNSIILPGVGAFDNAMRRLNDSGFSEKLQELASNGTPLLGICLGMQLLGNASEEGELDGLKLIPGKTCKFMLEGDFKIPHMGWNKVINSNTGLFENLEESKFYFVHSYHFVPEKEEYILGETNYGRKFVSSINKGNVFGAQFHPEKSHKYGMQLLKNYCAIQ